MIEAGRPRFPTLPLALARFLKSCLGIWKEWLNSAIFSRIFLPTGPFSGNFLPDRNAKDKDESMSVVAFGTLSAYQGSGIAAALWGRSLADRDQRQNRDPGGLLSDMRRQAAMAGNATMGPLLRKAAAVLEGVSSMDPDQARQTLASLNGILSQLAAVAPRAGAAVSKLAAETIDSLNNRAASLARSLGFYWSEVSVCQAGPSGDALSNGSLDGTQGGHLVDLYA